MKNNQLLQRANDLLNEKVEELESYAYKNNNNTSSGVLEQLEQIKSEGFQFKKKVSDTLMLAKDNKHLQETNKTLILKINELDSKNNDLLNKCKTIETESSIQLNNLRGKVEEVNRLNDNQ
jgi:hypothetical protein